MAAAFPHHAVSRMLAAAATPDARKRIPIPDDDLVEFLARVLATTERSQSSMRTAVIDRMHRKRYFTAKNFIQLILSRAQVPPAPRRIKVQQLESLARLFLISEDAVANTGTLIVAIVIAIAYRINPAFDDELPEAPEEIDKSDDDRADMSSDEGSNHGGFEMEDEE